MHSHAWASPAATAGGKMNIMYIAKNRGIMATNSASCVCVWINKYVYKLQLSTDPGAAWRWSPRHVRFTDWSCPICLSPIIYCHKTDQRVDVSGGCRSAVVKTVRKPLFTESCRFAAETFLLRLFKVYAGCKSGWNCSMVRFSIWRLLKNAHARGSRGAHFAPPTLLNVIWRSRPPGIGRCAAEQT